MIDPAWIDRHPRRDCKKLELFLPDDPKAQYAIRLWAEQHGYRLINKRRNSRFPYTCKHGHRVCGPDDERIYESNNRTYRYCVVCYRATQAKAKRNYSAKKKAARER